MEEERKRKHEEKPRMTKQLLVSQRIRIKHHVCASGYVRDARRSEDSNLHRTLHSAETRVSLSRHSRGGYLTIAWLTTSLVNGSTTTICSARTVHLIVGLGDVWLRRALEEYVCAIFELDGVEIISWGSHKYSPRIGIPTHKRFSRSHSLRIERTKTVHEILFIEDARYNLNLGHNFR